MGSTGDVLWLLCCRCVRDMDVYGLMFGAIRYVPMRTQQRTWFGWVERGQTHLERSSKCSALSLDNFIAHVKHFMLQ